MNPYYYPIRTKLDIYFAKFWGRPLVMPAYYGNSPNILTWYISLLGELDDDLIRYASSSWARLDRNACMLSGLEIIIQRRKNAINSALRF